MPLYDYECKKCETFFEEHMRMDDHLVPTKKPCPMNIGDPVRLGVTKPSSEFNDVLTRISDNNPRSKIHEKLSQGRRKRGLD